MRVLCRASRMLVLVCFLLPSVPIVASGRPGQASNNPGWASAASLSELVELLDVWLDNNGNYGRNPRPATIRIIERSELSSLSGAASRTGKHTRGLYDPQSATILLIRPWVPRQARDVSVLVHELVHHRQVGARHWYCPGAQEPDAYALQHAWLAERGQTLNVNRIAIALEAGCAPRDIHPD